MPRLEQHQRKAIIDSVWRALHGDVEVIRSRGTDLATTRDGVTERVLNGTETITIQVNGGAVDR